MFVPVTSKDGQQLMPTHPNKAEMLIKKGLATPYWSKGVTYIERFQRKVVCDPDMAAPDFLGHAKICW